MPTELSSYAEAQSAQDRINGLIDTGDVDSALRLAESLTGPTVVVESLRALALTHGGVARKDRDLVAAGAALWESQHQALGEGGGTAYNLGNAEQRLWELAVEGHGYSAALEHHREHLLKCRRLFRQAADDASVDIDTRVQALTNLGNSFDHQGRDVDALACWEQALRLRPDFAMSHGEIGICLAGIAPFMGEHAPQVVHQARVALDRALADPQQVAIYGSPAALRSFEQVQRELPEVRAAEINDDPAPTWADPHLRWCFERELFLHVSHACLNEDVKALDPVLIRAVHAPVDDSGRRRVNDLVDALNTVKQDYTAARYLTWLAADVDSPSREHADAVTRRAVYLDTLEYGRRGVRTGLASMAFASATNLLDKVSSFVHLYFETGRRSRTVYFKSLWHPPRSDRMDTELAHALAAPRANRGLLALCDLSCDLEEDTPLAALLDRRHAQTHRFLVAHEMLFEPEVGDWLDHVEWDSLIEQSVEQLRIARAAILYLVRAVDVQEYKTASDEAARGVERGRMTVHEVDPDLNEIA